MADESYEKVAMLLVTLGEEAAAEVLKHMQPREVQRLGITMAALESVPRDHMETILDEFLEQAASQGKIHIDSNNFVRNVLTRALGDDAAGTVLNRLMNGGNTNGIEGLKWMDAPTVADLIKNEHPQIIATILVHLEQDQASAILNQFTERLRNDVVLRIATLDGIQPKALEELNDVMLNIISGTNNLRKSSRGGVRAVADILNYIGQANEASVLNAVRDYDPDLAQKIQDEMFVFENILEIEDRSIQVILREIQSDSLVLALKGTSDALRDKILKNMSQRAAEMLREDLESRGPVRLSEVEAEQKEILKVVRRLVEEGTIILGGAGGEPMV